MTTDNRTALIEQLRGVEAMALGLHIAASDRGQQRPLTLTELGEVVVACGTAAVALEALSSSAPVETPKCEGCANAWPLLLPTNEARGAPVWHEPPDGEPVECRSPVERWASLIAELRSTRLGGPSRDRVIQIAEALAEMLARSSPADPPIPSPGDEEGKDAIAKVIREAVRGHLCSDDPIIGKIAQALSDYEIKAGGK